jgi:hypothetical protein
MQMDIQRGLGSSGSQVRILPPRQNRGVFQLDRLLDYESSDGSSNLLTSTVLVAYLVNVPDCESGEQGSIPANTLNIALSSNGRITDFESVDAWFEPR